MLEVGPIDSELVVGIELSLVRESSCPRRGAITFEDIHTMVNGWAVVFTPHLYLGRRRVTARISSENNIPGAIEIV